MVISLCKVWWTSQLAITYNATLWTIFALNRPMTPGFPLLEAKALSYLDSSRGCWEVGRGQGLGERRQHLPRAGQLSSQTSTNQQEERCVKKSILGRRKTKYMSRRTLGWQQSHWRRPHSWFYLAAIDTSTWAGKEKYVFSIHFLRNRAKNYCVTQLQLYTLYKLSSTIFCCLWVSEWVSVSGRDQCHQSKYTLFPIYRGI